MEARWSEVCRQIHPMYSIYGWGWRFDTSGVSVIHRSAWNINSANFACTEFSEVDISALCVAPSLCGRNSYVEITGSWPCLHKTLSGAGRWIRANFAMKLSEKSQRCSKNGPTGHRSARFGPGVATKFTPKH